LLLLAACKQSGGGTDAGAPEDLASGDVLSSDESAAFVRGSTPSIAVQQLSVLADSIFDFDPTLNPALDANGNAAAIQAQLQGQLGAGDGGATDCGSIMLSGATVTASFGTGCTLASGVSIAGTVTATVSKSGSSITVQLDFPILVVNYKNIGGSATFTTSDGNSFTVDANLTAAATTITVTNLAVLGVPGAITVSGMVGSSGADGTSMLSFTTVTWQPTDCYPNSGTLYIKSGLISESITFDSSTPTTGKVTVSIGKRTLPAKLPAYGRCPPP
jgi:hypothetical protein